ncbi:invasin domain 3-containing protein, partial [Citrobacter amalonaticus]|uniref:invasin domain 3-containing protein n=1 Tax=Citrobacter amalonaticus TaxID=35703 RepID=UPI00207C7481
VADGTDTSTLTMTAKDAFGNVITGIASNLTLEIKDSEGAAPAVDSVTLTTLVEDVSTPGIYTATLTGKMEGVYTVKPQFNFAAIGSLSASVTLLSHDPDGAHSTLTADPASVAADGMAISTLTFTARDLSDNAVTGIASALAFEVKGSMGNIPTAQQVTVSSVTETGTAGTYTATLKGTLADSYTVVPLNNGSAVGTLNAAVTLTPGEIDGGVSLFTAYPHIIAADDSALSTLTLEAKDKFGNAVAGLAPTLSIQVENSKGQAPADGKVTVSSVTETAMPGTYTATLKGQLADVYKVVPQLSGGNIGELSDSVTLEVGEPDGTVSTFSANPESVQADNVETSTLTLNLMDAFGNPISGVETMLGTKVTGSDGKTPNYKNYSVSGYTESSTAPGTYTAKIKSVLVDTFTVKPMFNIEVLNENLSDTVEFTPARFADVTANGYTFSSVAGFPTTGFNSAKFTLNLPGGEVASNYSWTSSQSSWAAVSAAGLVTFQNGSTSVPSAGTKSVTITATPKSTGITRVYKFTLSSWWVYGTAIDNYSESMKWCSGSMNSTIPLRANLTNAVNVGDTASRAVGSLWSEWGSMSTYGWRSGPYFSSEIAPAGSPYYYGANIDKDGSLTTINGGQAKSYGGAQACMRAL